MTDLNDFQLSVDLLKILFPDVFCGNEIDFVKLRSKLVPLLHKNGELPALNWNEKNSLKKAPFSGVRFHPLSNGAAPFGERNAFICGQPLKALQLLQKTHNGKIRLAIVDVPSPSEQSLKKNAGRFNPLFKFRPSRLMRGKTALTPKRLCLSIRKQRPVPLR